MALDKNLFEVETSNGVATAKYTNEGAFYEDTELTKTVIKEVFDHAHDYIESATVAASEKATEIMEADSSVDKVVMSFPYGVSKRGSIDVIANRSQTFRNPTDPDKSVTKSTLKVAVSDPLTKVSKSKVRDLAGKMTESLLS